MSILDESDLWPMPTFSAKTGVFPVAMWRVRLSIFAKRIFLLKNTKVQTIWISIFVSTPSAAKFSAIITVVDELFLVQPDITLHLVFN